MKECNVFKYLKEIKRQKKLNKLPLIQKEKILLNEKYLGYPRYKDENIDFLGYSLKTPDCMSFLFQFGEIFVDEIYKFKSSKKSPVIIDCGSNIGLSCLYFAKNHPDSKIYAFEADEKIFTILSSNMKNNNINNIELYNKAVWIKEEELSFSSEGADGGSIYDTSDSKIKVQAIRFKEFLEKFTTIDFLKIDIEGAETEVLKDIETELNKVENLFVEYHSITGQPQTLDQILKILTQNNFRYYTQTMNDINIPFINKSGKQYMDLQMNIFAYRVDSNE